MEEKESKERTPFDALLKHMADSYRYELVGYLEDWDDLAECEPTGEEVEITHRLSDRAYRVQRAREDGTKSPPFLVHLEFEGAYEAGIGRRLGLYGWGLYEREKLPVRHIVWYVSEDKPSKWPEGKWKRWQQEQMEVDGEVESWVRWQEVWLPGAYDLATFVKEVPAYLLPFGAMITGVTREQTQTLQDAIRNAPLRDDQKQDLMVMLVFFLARVLKLSKKELVQMIDVNELKKNPLGLLVFEQGLEQGLELGLIKGREEGREEGRWEAVRGLRAAVVVLLSRRVQGLPLNWLEWLDSCDQPELLQGLLVEVAELHQQDAIDQLLRTKLLPSP